jgi:hypothetical protein
MQCNIDEQNDMEVVKNKSKCQPKLTGHKIKVKGWHKT